MTDSSATRVAAILGPYESGKTSLLESLLAVTDTVHRKGTASDGTRVGDVSPEAKARHMSTETAIATTSYLGETWTFLDCPGSADFRQETLNVLSVVDAVVVVADPDPTRAVMLAPILKELDGRDLPHLIFINRIEESRNPVRETLEVIQAVSDRPLVLREVPIRDGDAITGYVDLVSERAYRYREGQPSELIKIPAAVLDRETEARQDMLESLADFDDRLLEGLLEDVVPPKEEIYESLARDVAEDLVVPVFFGEAERDHGVRRLLKALRHDMPRPEATRHRLGIQDADTLQASIWRTVHAQHTGKLSVARVWTGRVADGDQVAGQKLSGLYAIQGSDATKSAPVGPGAVVAFGKLEDARTGDTLTPAAIMPGDIPVLPPLFATALTATKRGDEVKLTGALGRICEEDPSLRIDQNPDTGDLLLWGQGETHLAVAVDRLQRQFNVSVDRKRPRVPYQETIRKAVTQRGRHKRQTGGHGQFGDVELQIAPQPRGAGFVFADRIVGGVVPRQYIPAVERGCREALARGPLGFPVVDIAVTLTDGSYHSVDSSDQAFITAAGIAMREGLAAAGPVLLEPILAIEVSIPSDGTSRVQRALSQRRGQILGFDAKQGWTGWDVVQAHLPQAELHDLALDLRGISMGVGTFTWQVDHLEELAGKQAEKVIADAKAGAG